MKLRKNMHPRRWLPAIVAALVLAGCAGYASHRDGLTLLEQNKYEDAVVKLSEASRQAPGNFEYRSDYVRAREQVVNRLLTIGNEERIAERLDAAMAAYQRVQQVDPGNARAESGLAAVAMDRRHLATIAEAQALFEKGVPDGATALLKLILLENVNHRKALALQRQINERDAKRLTAEPTLRASLKKPVTLQFREANLRMVFESLSRSSGINIMLDKDVRADLRTSIFVRDVSVEDTIDLILMQNQLEKKVLSDNTIFVYPNLPAKIREYQDLKVRTFHLVHADAKQMLTIIKTMLKTKDIVVHDKTNSLIMRDTPDAIRLAEKLVADQDIADPEVMLELELLEVTHNMLEDMGIQYPGMLTVTPTSPTGGAVTLGNLSALTTRDNMVVTPVPTVTLTASLTKSNTNILASPRLRARNKEKAKIHIGDRLPVFTNSVTPLATGAAVTTGSVQYIETGIKLEVEPTIRGNGDVEIKINLEVSVASAPVTNTVSGTTAYPVSTRTASTVLTLRDGETSVLAGLVRDTEINSRIMIPGVGQIPILGRLFGTNHEDGQKTEIILSITPRLVGSMNVPNAQLVDFFSGSEAALRSEKLVLRLTDSLTMLSSGGQPSPAVAVVPPPPRPGSPAAPPPAALPAAFTWQGPAQASVGSRFTLTLNAQSPDAVRNLSLMLSYDPALLKAVDAVDGAFLKQGGGVVNFTRDIDQASGQIAIEAANSGGQGAKGGGSVTAITFEVVATGQAQVSVTRMAVVGPAGEAVNVGPPAIHIVSTTAGGASPNPTP